jgi:hypothetical protein
MEEIESLAAVSSAGRCAWRLVVYSSIEVQQRSGRMILAVSNRGCKGMLRFRKRSTWRHFEVARERAGLCVDRRWFCDDVDGGYMRSGDASGHEIPVANVDDAGVEGQNTGGR